MAHLEAMRRVVFLLISIWSTLGVQIMGQATNCVGERDSDGELGDPSFVLDNAHRVYSTECQYRVLQCKSINFCTIQWFFNGTSYDSWKLGSNSGTKYLLGEGNQTLKFTSADVDAMGNYTCVVSNGVKNISRDINLVIQEGIWLNKPIPYESTSAVCKNQTAILGGNASFFCQFKYRKPGVFLQNSWRKLNETYGGYELVSFYDILVTQFTEGKRTDEESFLQNKICPELESPKILSTWLNITNVTEEALGKYQVTCKISQYFTAINLTLSLVPTDGPITRVTDTRSVVGLVATMVLLLSLFVLSWKRYGTDAKLWYHDRHEKLETEEMDSKLYDAYIVSCYDGKDRSFVDNILYPSLQDQYKLFLRERDATFGSVESEEIVEALTKSRRCIVIMSADFYQPSPTSSSESTSVQPNPTAVQPNPLPSSSSSSSSSSSVEIPERESSRTEWHLFELQQALDIMHADVIPLLYRDSGPTSSSTSDSNAKLVDHVIKDLKCIEWKQKGVSCLDDWALKRLRLRLPPRRRSNKSPSGLPMSATMPVTSATAPSNISSSISLDPPRSVPTDRPDVDRSNQNHSASVSESESSNCAVDFIEEGARSFQLKRPSQSSQISFMSTSMSPSSLSPSRSLASSYGSGSMSITSSDPQRIHPPSSQYSLSLAHSSSNDSTDPPIEQEVDNINSFQEYEPNSNRFNSSLSVFQFFPRRKKEPYLIDNESKPGCL